MAKVALVLDKLDDAAEPLRALYVERDGKFYLDADLPDVAGAEAAVAEEKRKREAAEGAMRKAVQEAERLKNAKKAADAGLKGDELEQLRADVRAEVMAEVAPQLADAEKTKAQNRALTLDATQKAKALKLGVLPEKVEDFWALRGSEFDLTEDGKPMVKGKPGADPDKHLAALVKRNPEWVAGTRATGGGAGGGAGGAGTPGGMNYEQIHANPEAALRQIAEATS